MDFKLSRLISLIVVFLSACSATVSPRPDSIPSGATPGLLPITPETRSTPVFIKETTAFPPLTGRVVDVDGNPLVGARIDSDSNSTVSSADGSFSLPGVGNPQWVRASLDGFIARTRAVGPNQPAIFRLSPDDGQTVVLQFAGDVMFGRRFFDPNSDGDPSDGLLPIQPSVEDHLNLLASIQPLIADADLMVVNLESPFHDQIYLSSVDANLLEFHPNKHYVFYSHGSAIQALKQAGVDVVGLGNNHVYDLLEDGLTKTFSILQENDLAHFGAGHDEVSAWKPAIAEVGDQRIAFVGCTTIWRPTPPITANDVTYVAQDNIPKGGAARCLESRLYQVVSEARQQADLVVVMIHGGYEYSRAPSKSIENYSKIARAAGATLIINHHPHVVGGLTWEDHTLTAWSLGNFIFDQLVWPTFETYILTVYVRNGEVVRAFTEPLIIDNYMPHGLVGSMADYVARGAAGRIPGKFIVEAGYAELNLDGRAKKKITLQTLKGDPSTGTIFPVPEGQWVSAFDGSGRLRLGRDLLWVGGFEPEMVHNLPSAPLLWTNRESQLFGQDFAYQGVGGIRLTRGKSNQSDTVTTHSNRILIEEGTLISVTGMARPAPGALTSLQVSWYSDLEGPSTQRVNQVLPLQTNGQWQPFRVDLQVPADIIAMGVIIRLSPPDMGTTTLDLDELRLIEWANPQVKFSSLYTHFLLKGEGKVSFRQDYLPLPP